MALKTAIFTVINSAWIDIFNVFVESWIYDKPGDVDFILYHDGSVDIELLNHKPDIFAEISEDDIKKLRKSDSHAHHKKGWEINASRIFVIEDFRDKYDKIIYLDADLLVLDIKYLLNFETNKCIAAVPAEFTPEVVNMIRDDMRINIRKYLRNIEQMRINPNGYINAGMMILNMKKIRLLPFNIKEIFIRSFSSLLFNDQDFLNILFSRDIEYLDRSYNFMPPPLININGDKNDTVSYSPRIQSYYDSFSKNAKVIHFLSGWRPWETGYITKQNIYDIGFIVNIYMKIFENTPNLSNNFRTLVINNYKKYTDEIISTCNF